jgi:predicted site-specific integrase-resolvase
VSSATPLPLPAASGAYTGPETGDTAPDRLLSLADAAALAQVDPNSLSRWARSGKVNSVRPEGSGWRKYRESEMRALAPGKMIAIGEACHLLRKSTKTLARMGNDGTLPCYPLPGGMRRFLEQDVLALKRRAEEQPGVTR